MENRLITFLETGLVCIVFSGLYWVVGFFCKSTFDFEIRSERGYAIVVGVAIASRVILIKVLNGEL